MSDLSNSEKDLIDFVMSYRSPVALFELAGDLQNLAEHGAQWPRATAQHWKREVEKLVGDGKLTEDTHGMIWVPAENIGPKQLTLF